jgi:hypothetical protein
MIATKLTALASAALLSSLASGVAFSDCKEKDGKDGVGLVPDAAIATPAATAPATAAAPTTDLSQCGGCSAASVASWSFEGVFRDAACTDPLVQAVTPACATVPAVGPVSVTFVDAVGARAAGAAATVTLKEQVAPEAPRYRKSGGACVRANEGATFVTPMSCAGQRVCRDAAGTLACANCRTLATGCPDHEETRTYATFDSGAQPGASGNANLARLRQCCAAIGAQARTLGASPEAGLLQAAAAQCIALVNAAGPNGNAPEISVVKTMLAGRQLPAVCAGL